MNQNYFSNHNRHMMWNVISIFFYLSCSEAETRARFTCTGIKCGDFYSYNLKCENASGTSKHNFEVDLVSCGSTKREISDWKNPYNRVCEFNDIDYSGIGQTDLIIKIENDSEENISCVDYNSSSDLGATGITCKDRAYVISNSCG